MRIGDIGGLAVVVLTALVGATPTMAAAPPMNLVVLDGGGPLRPLDLLPGRECRTPVVAQTPETCLPSPPGFLTRTGREFTIVVRVEDLSFVDNELTDYLDGWRRSLIAPAHAVRRDYAHFSDGVHEENSVLENLKQKLLELHDNNWFQVELSSSQGDRTEMRIQYRPVEVHSCWYSGCPPWYNLDQSQVFNFSLGFWP